MIMRGRTDLAVEMREDIQREEPVSGVHVMTKNNGDTDIKEVRIVVENEEGAMCLGKPVGTYITHCEGYKCCKSNYHTKP